MTARFRKTAAAVAGLAGALALVLTLGTTHQSKPNHVYDGAGTSHSAPQHVYDG